MIYQVALTNVAFDSNYKNVLRFDDRIKQKAYFNLDTLFLNAVNVNFNAGLLHRTSIVYKYQSAENLNKILNTNYAIVKDTENDFYYFYFVENCKQDSGPQVILDLKLDIFNTYYIDLKFGECNIRRAHLNRFLDNGDGTVSFDGRPESQLFENEDMPDVAKRLTKRTKLNLNFSENKISGLNGWIKEFVSCWQYIYVSSTNNYNIYSRNSTATTTSFNTLKYDAGDVGESDFDNLNGGVVCLCVPVYNSNKKIIFRKLGRPDLIITPFGLTSFLNKNNGASYVFSSKLSIMPPFNFKNYNNIQFSLDDDLNFIIEDTLSDEETILNIFGEQSNTSAIITYAVAGLSFQYGILNVSIQNNLGILSDYYTVSNDFTFSKEEIKNASKNYKYNPKLLSGKFKELSLKAGSSDVFNYDLQKLNKKEIEFKYNEVLSPDITRAYLRALTDNENIYIKECEQNFTGLVTSQDNSLPVENSQLANWLANNKNYYLQATLQNETAMAKSIMGAGSALIGGLASGNAVGAIAGFAGGLLSIGGTVVSNSANIKNLNYTIDNMRNAPSSLKNANGNAIFNEFITKNLVYIEEYDILENEKIQINDLMCQYGFTVNRIGNIKNYDNIRKYYNYIEADIEIINSDTLEISNAVRDEFRAVFNAGVRFWNNDSFSYQMENYERWLDEN